MDLYPRMMGGDDLGGLARAQHGAGVDGGGTLIFENLSGGCGLLEARLAETEARQPHISDLTRIFNVAVADEVQCGFQY